MKNITEKYLVIIVLILGLSNVVNGQNTFKHSKADSVLKALVDTKHIIGGVAAVSIDGDMVWQKAVGVMDNVAGHSFYCEVDYCSSSDAISRARETELGCPNSGIYF